MWVRLFASISVSQEKCKIMDKEIKSMLDNNITKPSSYRWESPFLLVDKADKCCRLTKPDPYPLLHIENCVDQVGLTHFFQ